MKQRALLAAALLLSCFLLEAQPREGYYDPAEGKSGEALRAALHDIIKGHKDVGYDGLYEVYETSDNKPGGKVWDMYSDIPGGTPEYEYSHGRRTCGTYHGEGDCYNREHSVPQSWFGERSPMKSDAFHVYPTDGYVNNRRGNFPFGEVSSPSWTSSNGSKVGTCSYPGYSGQVFEPIDEYKGDFARTYFYMSARYSDQNLGQSAGSAVFSGSQLKDWALKMFLEWHRQDPVSEKERVRNNAVEKHQRNRNPFIDYPQLVEHIWGTLKDVPFTEEGGQTPEAFRALPATNVSETGFTANWTASTGATGYTLDVYSIRTTGTTPSEVLLEADFMQGLPDGWTPGEGYTAAEADGYRLASGSKDGSVSTTVGLNGTAATLTVRAKQYKSDNSTLSLSVNEVNLQNWTMTADYADYTAELSADGQATVTLSAQADARVYLNSVRLETEGSKAEKVPADGYPVSLGHDVLSHDVSGLTPRATYYYTVTPLGNGVPTSAPVEVWTETNGTDDTLAPQAVRWFATDGVLHINNLPTGCALQVYNLMGNPVYVATATAPEVQVTLPQQGLYILRVGTRTYKIMNK